VIICTPCSIHRLTSKSNRAVAVMAIQQINMTTKEGKNPLIPVAIGRASMPPPIQVPPTRNIAETVSDKRGWPDLSMDLPSFRKIIKEAKYTIQGLM
jgi:hypothetical protein